MCEAIQKVLEAIRSLDLDNGSIKTTASNIHWDNVKIKELSIIKLENGRVFSIEADIEEPVQMLLKFNCIKK